MARDNGIHLVVGGVERDGGTLYRTALTFGPDGTLLGAHRKLMPSAMERVTWGTGDGSTLPVAATALRTQRAADEVGVVPMNPTREIPANRGVTMRPVVALLVVLALCSPATAQWTVRASGTRARLRGLSVVGDGVAWASGTGGTFLRTNDGGETWRAGTVPGASALDFRDVQAIDPMTAYLLSIGLGGQSRIFKTTDGGTTWTTPYINQDPKGFLDALAFRDAAHGLALGDPVDGRFLILTTADGGKTWAPIPPEGMPLARPGEGAFAASGTCLAVQGDGNAWFASGGAKVARVFRSTDGGRTWEAHETPVLAGTPSSGVFSLAFHDADRGVAVGGDYKEPGRAGGVIALTTDGGRTWRLPGGRAPGGYRSAVGYVPGTQGRTLVAVGPTGSDLSEDGGEAWRPLGTTGFHAVGFAGPAACWAVGDDGLVAKFESGGARGR